MASRLVNPSVALQLLGGALFGGVLGFLLIRAAAIGASKADPASARWLLAGLLLGTPAALALHELGHVFGGLSQGFRFWLFVVGPLRVNRDGDRLRFGWNRSIQLAGGVAACVPSTTIDLARRMAVMVAAGPLASILTAFLFWVLSLALPARPAKAMMAAAAMSAVIALATLSPLKSGDFHSDGARLLMYWRDQEAMERWARAAGIAGLAMSDQRPRLWPPDLVESARGSISPTLDGVGLALMLYYHSLDTSDHRAALYLDTVLDNAAQYPKPFRPALYLEGVYFEAMTRSRPAAARRLWQQTTGAVMVESYTRLRAEAALLLSEGRAAEARTKAEEALRVLDTRPQTGLARLERDLIGRILTAASSSQST